MTRMRLIWAQAWVRIDIRSIAVFRALFGFVMCVAILRLWFSGNFHAQWLAPRLHFPYPYLNFVCVLSAESMQLLLLGLFVSALCVALGLFYRPAIVLFFVGFTYLELIDRCTYLNHYYLVSMLCVLLSLIPAHGAFSLDALRTGIRLDVPTWMLWSLRLQIAVVYVFAGLAKLDADWLLRAQPLRLWFAAQRSLPWIGGLLAQSWVALAASWLGALFDLSVVYLLLRARTRAWAFAGLCAFHLTTGALFPIGMFPWIMLSAATLFFSPDWPSRLGLTRPDAAKLAPYFPSRLTTFLIACHVLIQCAVPVYQHSRSGFDTWGRSGAWTGKGFDFAWKVMLTERVAHVRYRVIEAETQSVSKVDASDYLTDRQLRALAQDPDLVRLLASHIGESHRRQGLVVEVFADAVMSLNGRTSQPWIDPRVDLTQTVLPQNWVLPPPP